MKLLLLLAVLLLSLPLVSAHCPLCTGAVVAAAAGAGYLGLDVSIVGLFVGAFGVSTGLWIGNKIKRIYIPFQLSLIVLLSFFSTIIPLMFMKNDIFLLSFMHRLFFVDKMLFGSFLGGFICLPGWWIHNHIKRVRGRVLFPYQGVVLTLGLLFASAATLYLSFRG